MDSMSDTTYITTDTMQKINPDYEDTQINISTMTSDNQKVHSHLVTNLTIRAYRDAIRYELPPTYSHKRLPINRNHIPTRNNLRNWPHLLNVAENLPMEHQNIPIGMLIGHNFTRAFRPKEIIKTDNEDEPFAIRTALGWSVMGNSKSKLDKTTLATVVDQPTNKEVVTFKCSTKTGKEIGKLLKLFSKEFADAHDETPGLSIEDKQFLDIMKQGTKLGQDGRVSMPLPFKAKPIHQNTKSAAMHRFKLLEKKFQHDPKYREHYYEFMNDIISKGEAILANDEHENSWYIPHFGVYHPKKPSKIRVVFDCAAKVGGVSLNDFLLQGPEHINDLQGILMRFRSNHIAVMGDIERMFHQFKVTPDHQDYLRFLWYDAEGRPTTYKMTVHLFGARSSPACATYGLRYLADKYQSRVSTFEARDFIHNNFYVDDGLASVSTEAEAIRLVREAQALCITGNLRLHKLVSNSRAVMTAIPRSEQCSSLQKLNLDTDDLPHERSLGVIWDTNKDCLTFEFTDYAKPDTRRGVLSTVASIFDPLGFIAPFTMKGKSILQEICRSKAEWDEPLDERTLRKWTAWKNCVQDVQKINVPRCIKAPDFGEVATAELHTFSDASNTGYGQCSYIRLVDTTRRVHVSLLASKARVAPIKAVTIPRLELQAACGAARLASRIQDEMSIKDLKSYYYTDSKVVLGYINNTEDRFHTYVANRVEMIRSLTEPSGWKYIPTKENPADIASRGAEINYLNESIWFSGPEFLWCEPVIIPCQPQIETDPSDPEVRKVTSLATKQEPELDSLDQKLQRYSDWNRAVKDIAIVQQKLFGRDRDLEAARRSIIRATQRECFSADMQRLAKKQDITKSSPIYRLNPFLDDQGVLRVGGRLQQSSLLSFEEKYPTILPKQSHTTTLIIRHCHQLAAHQGREATLSKIRSKGYWVVSAKSVVYKHVDRCIICKRIRGRPLIPQMATLPFDRLAETPPFTHCGLDCFGPFVVKDGRKEKKTYGLIITCMASRAVHMELLEDMTSDSFINALRNLIAIRGPVKTIRCDQGTNFVGAFNDLAKNMEGQRSNLNIDFKFNPPHASNMGGVWERLIRSARNILKGMGEKYGGRLSTPQLRTLFYEVMAVMNSRPLGSITEDQMPLTPNMLLTMKSEITYPTPGTFEDADIYSRKRWRVVQQLANQFWCRWRNEYLQALQVRQKWVKKTSEVSVGDIVHVLKEEGLRNDWSLARVVECIKSHDAEVRSVKLFLGLRYIQRTILNISSGQ